MPSIVYLDQADWSYLHQGRMPCEERALRSLGESGAVQFLITMHHFEETSGLDDPAARTAFLRGFPGAVFTDVLGYDLLRFEALKLAEGRNLDAGRSIDVERLCELSAEDMNELTFGLKNTKLRKLIEPLHDRRRELFRLDQAALKAVGGNSTRRDDLLLWRAQMRGDFDETLAIWERTMTVKATALQQWKLFKRVLETAKWAADYERAGWLPPRDLDYDMTFVTTVFVLLPVRARMNRVIAQRMVESWPELLKRPSPAACSAAVTAAVLDNPARAYNSSEQLDALHATFAPLVDVFTGDKRTVDALRRVPIKSKAIRSQRLGEVVATLNELTVSRATPASSASASLTA